MTRTPATPCLPSSSGRWITPTTLAAAIGNIGGDQIGLQPPTLAFDPRRTPTVQDPTYGLNTTGLLVRVVGTVFGSEPYVGFYLDDGSTYGVWIDLPGEAFADGTILGVTGVSGVSWDGTNGIRTILADPDEPEIVVYREPTL